MGVINITPNSFSDSAETFTSDSIQQRLKFLSQFDIIDIGAESTFFMNASVSWETEWERWQMVLPFLKDLSCAISADSYHPETIFELLKYWKDHKLRSRFIWNDVSGKYDQYVRDYLKTGNDYVFCHNLAPNRELTGRHMEYVKREMDLFEYFHLHRHPQVIFDPCLGFSKSYEQNWEIIQNFGEIQEKLKHDRWLIGFSRKSFLRQKYAQQDREELDRLHALEVSQLVKKARGELWLRTHRPELITF